MCGLVALKALGQAQTDRAQLERMVDTIRHRGPDDSGVHLTGPFGLGFRRLSILDLSPAGHQPMVDAATGVAMVFNGEIYNYLELKKELEGLGHRFHSTGDSEVLLRAYLQWGRDCVKRFNGMWAFVIVDAARGLMFGSRDRFGIKPLFRCATGSAIAFASEIKALLAGGLLPPKPNHRVVANFLVDNRLDTSEETFFEGIHSVPAAHCFEVDAQGRYRQWRYWSIELERSGPADPAQAFAELFEDSARLHMRSDVPVAVHLSGGLDSTAIACALARLRRQEAAQGPLAAFCYMDPRFDERRYIDATLAQTGAQMVPLQATPLELWQSLPQVLQAHDEPFHSFTALVSYQLMRTTAEHGIKVVLNGQGADETLAGYGNYFRGYWCSLASRGSLLTLLAEMRAWSSANRRPLMPQMVDVLRRIVASRLNGLAAHRARSVRRWQARVLGIDWLNTGVAAAATPEEPPPFGLMKMLESSVLRDPLPIYLRVEDRNASAHSIESRVPFLDHRLVELAFSMAPEWHLRGSLNKFVLREAMRGRIPEVVRSRVDKMGFPTAASTWMRGELYEPMREVLTDPEFQRTDLLRPRRLLAMLDEHRAGQADHGEPLFGAVQWFLWQRQIGAQAVGTAPAPLTTR